MRHKSLFRQVGQKIGNHHDRAIQRYYEHQNADKNQIEHIKGNQKRWK